MHTEYGVWDNYLARLNEQNYIGHFKDAVERSTKELADWRVSHPPQETYQKGKRVDPSVSADRQ